MTVASAIRERLKTSLESGKSIEDARRRTLNNYYEFFKEFWSTVCPEEYVHANHIEYLCKELEIVGKRIINRDPKLYDLNINVPPGSTKTILISQLWNAWLWANDARIRFVGSSHDRTLSTSNSMKMRDCVLSEKYRLYFPHVELKPDQSGKLDFRTSAGGQRMSTSVTANVVGHHAHVLVADDLIDPGKLASWDIVQRANKHLVKGLTTRKVDPKVSAIVLVMQRLGVNDPTAAMLKHFPNVKHICLPASDDFPILPEEAKKIYTNGLLDPVRKPTEELEIQKQTFGEADYNAQFGQNPESTSGSIVKPESFTKAELPTDGADVAISFRYDDEGNKQYSAIAFRKSIDVSEIIADFHSPDLEEFNTVLSGFLYAYTKPSNTLYIELTKEIKPHLIYIYANSKIECNVEEVKISVKDVENNIMAALPEIQKGVKYSCSEEYISECLVFPYGPTNQAPGLLAMALIESLKSSVRGNKLFPAFSKDHISSAAQFMPSENVHAAHDQNVLPYFTQLLAHCIRVDENVYDLYIFDENCTKPPASNVIDNAKVFNRKYLTVGGELHLYADRSLKNRSSVDAGNASGFELMKKQYSNYLVVDKSHTKNPNVSVSARFVNMLLRGEAPAGLRVNFHINQKCVELIKDLTHLKTDGDGGKLIEHVTDTEGNRYEKLGHTSDTLRYLICKLFEYYYKKFRRGRQVSSGDAIYDSQ